MAEYIERKELIAEIGVMISRIKRNPYDSKEETKGTLCGLAHAIGCIKSHPTADVVPVVRCKDCKYFEIDEGDELGECKCGYIAVSYNGALYPHRTDYCSYGERRCSDG